MNYRRILGRVDRQEFVGRDRELDQIVRHPARGRDERGLLLLAAPPAGASELLRQAYDQLFAQRGDAVPIYFALTHRDGSALGAAQRFLTTFLRQYVAYRRIEPGLCEAPLALNDLAELALATDYEWISALISSYERQRVANDERAMVDFCFSAPQKANAAGRLIFPMIDGIQLVDALRGSDFAPRLVENFYRSQNPYAIAGPRRQLLDLARDADTPAGTSRRMTLDKLNDDDARVLVEHTARRNEVEINDQTRDLIAEQLGGSPFFITSLVQAARETGTPLNSFVNCQRLYVDELMGGRIHRHFTTMLDRVTSDHQIRRNLLRVLYESLLSEKHKSSLWAWKKRIGADASEFEHIIHQLHTSELVNSTGSFVEVNSESHVWHDYVSTSYRVDGAGEARALVVADTLVQTLKRAPRTMARHYRRQAALGLRGLLTHFNCQELPATLFHYDRFSPSYKGVDAEQVNAALNAESDLIRLPQIVHVASCQTFASMKPFCDEERCAIGHGFDAADYTDSSEVVWMAAEIDAKLEASAELTGEWCGRLAEIARECEFKRVRIWLIAPEGFSAEACSLLNKRNAYCSSRRQVELLTARLTPEARAGERQPTPAEEYEIVIPMGADNELIGARAVEQIARRLNFHPEAINQIKTALVEACINASEHSLSPERKIYQRFRVENDKLVVTVASRGVTPEGSVGENGAAETSIKNRRGWGLKLIRTLMDEVEFEHVDDGTRLRMVKYLRQ